MVSTRRRQAAAAETAATALREAEGGDPNASAKTPSTNATLPPTESSHKALESALEKLQKRKNIGYIFAARLEGGKPVVEALFDTVVTERKKMITPSQNSLRV